MNALKRFRWISVSCVGLGLILSFVQCSAKSKEKMVSSSGEIRQVQTFLQSYRNLFGAAQPEALRAYFDPSYFSRRSSKILKNLSGAPGGQARILVTEYRERGSQIFVKWREASESASLSDVQPWTILIHGGPHGFLIFDITDEIEPTDSSH